MGIDTKELQEYVDRMKKIRLLSTPDLDQITDGEEYSKLLLHNFSLIGMMAAENKKVIDQLIVKRQITRGGSGTLISAIFPPRRRVWIGGGTLWAA